MYTLEPAVLLGSPCKRNSKHKIIDGSQVFGAIFVWNEILELTKNILDRVSR